MKYDEMRHLRHALRTLEESISQMKSQISTTEMTIRSVGAMMDKVINDKDND